MSEYWSLLNDQPLECDIELYLLNMNHRIIGLFCGRFKCQFARNRSRGYWIEKDTNYIVLPHTHLEKRIKLYFNFNIPTPTQTALWVTSYVRREEVWLIGEAVWRSDGSDMGIVLGRGWGDRCPEPPTRAGACGQGKPHRSGPCFFCLGPCHVPVGP